MTKSLIILTLLPLLAAFSCFKTEESAHESLLLQAAGGANSHSLTANANSTSHTASANSTSNTRAAAWHAGLEAACCGTRSPACPASGVPGSWWLDHGRHSFEGILILVPNLGCHLSCWP